VALHPELPQRRELESRRTPPAFGSSPPRNPRRHGRALETQLNAVQQSRRISTGIDPDLMFKVRAANTRLPDETLASRGIVALAETVNYTYFVLASDEGSALADALRRYTTLGADTHGGHGPLYTLFDRIDAIEPYGSADRRGPGLEDVLTGVMRVVVDVSVWPADEWPEAERRAGIVADVVGTHEGEVLHRAVGVRRTVLRVAVNADGLADLLDTSVVERVRTPPVPFIDPSDWRDVDIDDLSVRTRRSVAVGVLDDAPAAEHPLLSGLVSSITEVGPAGYQWPTQGHHGTQVVSRVLLPHLAEELREHAEITAIGNVHVARILEPVPGRPDETRFGGGDAGLPPHEVVERSIRLLHEQHGVRVFNLSFGFREAFTAMHVSELTETIDDLARELDVVIVVPTGNAAVYTNSETISGHHAENDYPAYLSDPSYRLAEPGPAALALTVGSIAHSDAPVERPGAPRLRDKAIAGVGELSPFSRTGPGIGKLTSRSNKPDLVHYGGNWVHDGDTNSVILEDSGVGVVTAALDGSGRLFRAACGTSFAAPAVARCAADVLAAYPDASANLVRALVAASARQPSGAIETADITERLRRYGFGRPDAARAVDSGARRVTMTFDGDIAADTVVLHPVPMPEAFVTGRSVTRRIQVCCAYDPPVRRQRREYLAGTMQLDLYRAIDIDDLAEIVAKQDPDDPSPAVRDRRRVAGLQPGVDSVRNGTLHVRTWQARQMQADDGETYFLAVTHRTQTWARAKLGYDRQRYALAVTIEDEARADIDLFALVTQRVALPARVRIRA